MNFFYLIKYIPFYLALSLNGESLPEVKLSFNDALERTLRQHPALAENIAQTEVAAGQIQQAGRLPNPVISAELGNFLGSGPMRGVQSLEFTLSLSQTLETAKKRPRRVELAKAQYAETLWEAKILRLEIEARLRAAFVNALLAAKDLSLRQEQVQLAKASAAETERLVKAALSPQVEAARAQLAVRQQNFALQSAQRAYASAKAELASLWSEAPESENFEPVGSLALSPDLPAYETLSAQLHANPSLAAFKAQNRRYEAAIQLEKARAVPDLEVFAGGRYFNEADGDGAFILGLQIPWPLFDKNKGNIHSATALRHANQQAKIRLQRSLRIQLNRAYQALTTAHAEVHSIARELLPAAKETLSRTEAGYQQGKFTQLAVLEARQTLFDLRESHLNALRDYNLAQTEILKLTASLPNTP